MNDRRDKTADETLDYEAMERICIMVIDGKVSEEEAIAYAELDYAERMAKKGGGK